ncbi:serine/threonine-protein kinase [Capillibacterium thermochitinicola]|uniref:Protein kinase domain-containing protein n=1 Tax=Capillibacterium thermochitinicola TaxID=2699427 RepID=A0A8J6LLD1_9FIRM|nr:hypothetical protein [Capillibacterium thermochitinicola]MBA2131988.1 hypothetical protein [Capillibacterium thermochitinicola]
MGLSQKATKTAGDGATLWLVVDERGEKYLFEPLGLTQPPKEKIFLEILRELRQTIQTPLRLATAWPVFTYRGIEKCGDETGLVLVYDEELWANWEAKGQVLPPSAVAAVAQELLSMVPTSDEGTPEFIPFYPGDLVPLGDGRWGLLDPRVQYLLAPYRAGGEQRSFYEAPEVIAGGPRTPAAYLYTLGLTLFYLATGEFPFPVHDRRETVTAMLREDPPDPRYFQPQIGGGLAEFLLKLLSRNPQDRPDVPASQAALQQAMAAGTLVAKPEEATRFRAEAETVRAKTARKRQWYWRWQHYKWPVAAVLGLVLIVFLLLRGGGYEEKITPATTPEEVVAVFYDGLARLDPLQMEEALAKGVGREFIDMVSVLHVTGKIREAYERITDPFLDLTALTIVEAEASTAERPVFTAVYRLRIRQGDIWINQERRDRLVLEKHKMKWQIILLDSAVLAEERTPVPGSVPPGVLDISNEVR